ncbi:MAG: alpha/beta hydrolase [Parafilimonas sp.]
MNKANSQDTLPRWKTLPAVEPMPKSDNSGMAAINGALLYYAVFNNNGKDPVLLLHGGFTNSDDWGDEVIRLCKTHKVIVTDTRGHGRSSMSAQPFTYNLFASDVLALLDTLHIQKVAIIGWSDGGVSGLLLAIHHPERISRLFTFGANYNQSAYKTEPPDSTMSAHFMAKVQADYKRLSPTPDSFPKLRKALGKLYSAEPDIPPADLKKIHCPVTIALGEYDQFIKREHAEEMAQLIPGAKLVVIKGVSHGGPLQDPDLFHEAVMQWLSNKE